MKNLVIGMGMLSLVGAAGQAQAQGKATECYVPVNQIQLIEQFSGFGGIPIGALNGEPQKEIKVCKTEADLTIIVLVEDVEEYEFNDYVEDGEFIEATEKSGVYKLDRISEDHPCKRRALYLEVGIAENQTSRRLEIVIQCDDAGSREY
ncbi:MAG: hypothetical protein R3A11_07040 [Bdellovibrionota bacterium]